MTVLQEDLNIIADAPLPYEKLNHAVVLVTGATGLIGVSLIRAIAAIKQKYGFDTRVIGWIRDREKANRIFGNLMGEKDFTWIVGDIVQPPVIQENIDYIFHCASVTASKTMVNFPVETIVTAVMGTKNLLELGAKCHVKSFVYVSSMEVYGSFDTEAKEVTEKEFGYLNPIEVRSNYPESKRLCENMCIAYWKEYGVPVKIARLAQTFGAGILPGENRVFAQFARCVLNHQNIVLHTKGTSEGNYCYLRDGILGLLGILLNGEVGEAYNVANPETHTTIAAMAKMVCERIAGGEISVEFDIPRENTYGYAADTRMKLNADKLMALGWKPQVGLEEAYRRLIRSMKENE